jgi:hypothetical protein
VFGGTATDRTIANTCSGAASNPNFLVTVGGVNYCDQTNSGIPWRTQFKLAGTFPLPWWGITTAASFQALPGYILGTSALTAGGAGAPNFTSQRVASSWTVTPTTADTSSALATPRRRAASSVRAWCLRGSTPDPSRCRSTRQGRY